MFILRQFHFHAYKAICSKLLKKIIYFKPQKNLLLLQLAWSMNIGIYHFIVLILIIHVLLYDRRQANYYCIRKSYDKTTKIILCCRGGGLNLRPLTTSGFLELKY